MRSSASTNLSLSHGNDCSLKTESAPWTPSSHVVSDTYLTLVSDDEADNAITHAEFSVPVDNYLVPVDNNTEFNIVADDSDDYLIVLDDSCAATDDSSSTANKPAINARTN